MNWDKILVESIALLIQHIAYKWAKSNPKHRLWAVIMMVVACGMSLMLTEAVIVPLGLLVLSIALWL